MCGARLHAPNCIWRLTLPPTTHSVLGDAIHFVLRGLKGSKFADIANQHMQRAGNSKHNGDTSVSATLTFQLPAGSEDAAADALHRIEFTRTSTLAPSRSSVMMRDAHGQMQLSEVEPTCILICGAAHGIALAIQRNACERDA